MTVQTPAANSRETGTERYCVTLFTHGRRALLTGEGAGGGGRLPTPTGNAVAVTWMALSQERPQLITEALYLMPSSVCILMRVKGGVGNVALLRLLNSAIRRFKDETTRQYNSSSTQDYRSRLWQTTFECEPVTPAQRTAFERQMAIQDAYRAV